MYHMQCDEKHPSCKKCTSTGRKCDGYALDNIKQTATVPSPIYGSATKQAFDTLYLNRLMSGGTASVELYDPQPLSDPPIIGRFFPPLFPVSAMSDYLPGRAFHYFIHRSAADLTGPLDCSIWQEHVLSVCMKSSALQSAIVALAGFHEKFTISTSQISDEQCWRQYSIAVKNTAHLIEAASRPRNEFKKSQTVITDELLVACVIFITIELLLGEFDTATRHIVSGFGLFQSYLLQSHINSAEFPACDHSKPTSCCSFGTLSPMSPLNPCVKSLLAVFSRMDMQLLSFLPRRYYARHLNEMSQDDHIRYEILQLAQPFPDEPTAKLYQMIRRILYWIHYFAMPHKYSGNHPQELYATQEELLQSLNYWKDQYQEGKEPEFHWLSTNTEPPITVAHILLTYHLTILKLSASLCPNESVYASPDSMRTICAILAYAFIILKRRNAELDPIYLPKTQTDHYFSLESSIVEALYYTSTKCRHSLLRKCALGLLKCAGREGVWDSTVMACVAEYLTNLEEGNTSAASVPPAKFSSDKKGRQEKEISGLPFCMAGKLANEMIRKVLLGEDVPDLFRDILMEEERLVNTVHFEIDKLTTKVEIECGWFDEAQAKWRYEKKMLEYKGYWDKAVSP
ncbi:hypothetical protein DM02DRAFT_623048 [Periconia macrospinosa]|uniref:Zn(2)-C6 fungal-type domain-containing protein n=1 Tax=Periconia macrospinosa TaxID=97972 RepID=A0A2V1E7I0_9PLEO|nr:hypothetical protein DM02DRAFT_623048 [Periconia macrospinosa]